MARHPEQLLDAVMQAGVWHVGGRYEFAGGAVSNNKFEMPDLLKDPLAKEMVLEDMGKEVVKYDPQALWGVPSGGQEFALHLGRRLQLPVITLKKVEAEPGRRRYQYASDLVQELAQHSECLVGVEDISNRLTSIAGALELEELREKTARLVIAMRRGTTEIERMLPVAISWSIEQSVPDLITPDHPFYRKYAHLAVREA